MNIEELELSLRTEFEGQIRNVLAGIKSDVAEFHSKFSAELESHRNRLDQAIAELSSKLPESAAFDAAFNESVNEHLRLARDDGAQVAATAFGEAEKLRTEAPAAVTGGFDLLRDAIADVSSKNTQASILQSLVVHASRFAARGAFFIVKNDQFVGWKVFGSTVGEESVRELLFSTSKETVLAAAARSMMKASAPDAYSDDSLFLDHLQFGRPAELHAFPLVARGRSVAVLYADRGEDGEINSDALETLVRVAAMTVELLAASNSVPAPRPAVPAQSNDLPAVSTMDHAATQQETVQEASVNEDAEPPMVSAVEDPVSSDQPASEFSNVASEQYEQQSTVEEMAEYTGEVTYEIEEERPSEMSEAVSYSAPIAEETIADHNSAEEAIPAATMVEAPVVERFEPTAHVEPEPATSFEFSSNSAYEVPYVESPQNLSHVPMVEAPAAVNMNAVAEVATVAEPVVQQVVEVATAEPKKSRFSDRQVDLPIEVADEERKLHNDARRFARLLVSEIKLYNKEKVEEARDAGNLYQQLKEAIDRSREMYDKRVQPAVASKFDYFHYEVVNSLADGQTEKLGSGYPGATV